MIDSVGDALDSAALKFIDGTASPKRTIGVKEELEFAGSGVTLTEVGKRLVATISGGLAGIVGSGVDGATVDNTGVGTFLVRASRVDHVATWSATQTNYSSGNSATADIWHIDVTGASQTLASIAAPGVNDTTFHILYNDDATGTIAVSHLAGNIRCPGNVTLSLPANGGTCGVWWNPTVSTWDVVFSGVATGGVTDHGALTGLGDDDHTQYILVAGTRAFTGNQSMGGNSLTAVDQLVMNSSSSIIDMNGGDITDVDDITANGSGSIWNLSDGSLRNAAFADFTHAGATSTPSADELRLGNRWGVPHFKQPNKALWKYPIFSGYNESVSLGTPLADITIDFSNIDGMDLSDGVFEIEAYAWSVDNDSGSDSYHEHRFWHVHFTSGAPTSASVTERLFDGAAFDMDSRGPVYGSVTVSGQVVTMTRNHIFGGGTARHWHVILISGMGGT